jgi:hypothetical protein
MMFYGNWSNIIWDEFYDLWKIYLCVIKVHVRHEFLKSNDIDLLCTCICI